MSSLLFRTTGKRFIVTNCWKSELRCFKSSSSVLRSPNYVTSSIFRQQVPVIDNINNKVLQSQQQRYYTPMTVEEEEKEKVRVANLSPFQKDQELRKLNRQIAKLEMLKGINTGELYTWSGRYKALARDYGMPLFAWYWTVWTSTAILCYGAITVFDIDTMAIFAQIDSKTGWDLVSKVDPEMGKIGMAILLNEAIEPLRLPAVIVSVKPVMDKVFPPKY